MSRRMRPNTRLGGHAAKIGWRQIEANPTGNREERRAAKKLGVVESAQERTEETAAGEATS